MISTLAFSPDGQILCSGGEDGKIKLWSLGQQKLLTELGNTDYPITALKFNPATCTLASASTEKTIRYWDIDEFSQIYQTPPETTPIRKLQFLNDGSHIFASANETMKV